MAGADLEIAGRFTTAASAIAWLKAKEKFPELNHRLMKEEARKLGEKLRDGAISPAQFQAAMEKELKSSVVAAYRFETKAKLTDVQIEAVNALLGKQGDYLAGFLKDVASRDPGDWIVHRAGQYSGAVTQARAEGTLAAKEDEETLEWSGPDGEESCPDCADLIGTSKTVAEWRGSGETPGNVACGPNCRCSLG